MGKNWISSLQVKTGDIVTPDDRTPTTRDTMQYKLVPKDLRSGKTLEVLPQKILKIRLDNPIMRTDLKNFKDFKNRLDYSMATIMIHPYIPEALFVVVVCIFIIQCSC